MGRTINPTGNTKTNDQEGADVTTTITQEVAETLLARRSTELYKNERPTWFSITNATTATTATTTTIKFLALAIFFQAAVSIAVPILPDESAVDHVPDVDGDYSVLRKPFLLQRFSRSDRSPQSRGESLN